MSGTKKPTWSRKTSSPSGSCRSAAASVAMALLRMSQPHQVYRAPMISEQAIRAAALAHPRPLGQFDLHLRSAAAMDHPLPALLSRQDGTHVAHHPPPAGAAGAGLPGVTFLGGFKSDMEGGKAL